ncbi:MAG: arabinosyltransferase C-terminal domain-containing protein, partial [Sciscionella sp.]
FRLIAVSLLGLAVLAVTPTKWTHHFGAFAALGGALAGLTAVVVAPGVLRRWHRALFTAVLFLLAAAALEGPNTWWYISAWGVGSQPTPVTFAGLPLVMVALVCAAVALAVAALEYLLRWRSVRARRLAPGVLRVLAAPLAVVCAAMVGFELLTFTAVVPQRWDTYSLGGDNVRQVAGAGGCGLSDSLRVERNPLAGMLSPVSGSQPGTGNSASGVRHGGVRHGGFRRGGLPPSDPTRDWTPPYGMGGDDAPVWGSYPEATADFGSGWYRLPAPARSGAVPLVVSMAGESVGKNAVRLEFGRRAGRGFQVVATVRPAEQLGAPGWRDARTTLTGAAARASVVRVVATDADPGRDGWLAVSAPRVPEVVSMTRLIGDSPSFVEWPAALVHPCLRPFRVRDGIAEPPKYLVGPGTKTRGMGLGQSEPLAGGPFGWLNSMAAVRKLPTYLRGDVSRDWGDLYAVDYRQAGVSASAAVHVRPRTRWGWYSPGPMSRPVDIPGEPAVDPVVSGSRPPYPG